MDTTREALEYRPHFSELSKGKECKVAIEIEQNEESYTDANLFSSITIYEETNGIKRKFFEMETA